MKLLATQHLLSAGSSTYSRHWDPQLLSVHSTHHRNWKNEILNPPIIGI